MTVKNAKGNRHGVEVDGDKTRITGGQNSTSVQIDDRGVTLANTSTGGPATLTGVADGRADLDAVNFRQLQGAYAGIAGVAALAAIPQPLPGKKHSVGLGAGSFKGSQAIAAGYKGVIQENISVTLGASISLNGGKKASAVNAGIGWSW
jgi:autotransporter adhesin